jgi:hypothetical protein
MWEDFLARQLHRGALLRTNGRSENKLRDANLLKLRNPLHALGWCTPYAEGVQHPIRDGSKGISEITFGKGLGHALGCFRSDAVPF